MPQPTLGKLETLSLRELWRNEERDFTPWLVQNIDQLSELLGVQIIVEQAEKRVGRYERDILGRTENGSIVIVENQLEGTDHTHLGQLLTYAAGLDAAIVVWVAPEVCDEHRRAIEWLNNKIVDEVSFFLVRPEVFSISGSPPAVRFNLEAAPSKFSRHLRGTTQSPWRDFLRDFWEDLCPYLAAHGDGWAQGRAAMSENYLYSTVGKSGVSVGVDFNKSLSRIFVRIWLEGDTAERQTVKSRFDLLAGYRSSIEPEFLDEDLPLFWERRDDKNCSTVFVARSYDWDNILEATPEREALFLWIARNLTAFRKIAIDYLVDGRTQSENFSDSVDKSLNAEPAVHFEGELSDESEHAPMLANEVANRMSDDLAEIQAFKLGFTEDQVAKLIRHPSRTTDLNPGQDDSQ